MSVNVTMPKLGMTMKVGKVSKWYKNEGDSVEKGENLFEVETEKITNKIESPGSGILFQIVVPNGCSELWFQVVVPNGGSKWWF